MDAIAALVVQISLVDRFCGPVQKIVRDTERLRRTAEMAKGPLRSLGTTLVSASRVGLSGVSALGDGVSRALHRIKVSVFSLKGALLGLGAAWAGKSFLEATIGGAAEMQKYRVGVNHWFKGNLKAADAYFAQLKGLANKTPFSDADIYGGATTAVGVAKGIFPKGDANLVAKAAFHVQQIAADMAAIGGTDYGSAMDAIRAAQAGEMDPLKRYGFKITAKDFKQMGFAGIVRQLRATFQGGAEALSKTLSGQWSTLRGNMSSFFAAAGGKGGEALTGGLERINAWWEKNQSRISKWAEALGNVLGKGIDLLLSKLERFGAWLDKNIIGNKAFQDLDFAHQIDFLWKAAEPSVVGIGKQIGLALGKGVALGLKGSFGMALEGVQEGDWSKALTGGLLGGGILKMTGLGDLLGGGWNMGKKMLGPRSSSAPGTFPGGSVPVPGVLPGGMGKMADLSKKALGGIGDLGKGAWTGAMSALGKVQDVAAVGMHKLTGAVGRASTAFLAGAKSAWAFSMGLAGKMISSLKVFGMTLWTKVIPAVWSFTVALLTNPITWIVLGVVALGAALVLLALNWDKVKAAALRCWESIKGGAAAVRDWIVAKISGALLWVRAQWDGLCAWFAQLPAQIGVALAGIGEVIMAPFRAAFGWILDKLNAIKGAWTSFKGALIGAPGATPGAAPTGGPSGGGLPGHALGGIFSKPHVAMFAEAGPEAVIPLSGMKDRAMKIWMEAGRRLGALGSMALPAGGDGSPASLLGAGSVPIMPPMPSPLGVGGGTRPVPAPTAGRNPGTATAPASAGGNRQITLTGPITIQVSGADDPRSFTETLARELRRVVDQRVGIPEVV